LDEKSKLELGEKQNVQKAMQCFFTNAPDSFFPATDIVFFVSE